MTMLLYQTSLPTTVRKEENNDNVSWSFILMRKILKVLMLFCSLFLAASAFPQSHHSSTPSTKPHTTTSKKASGNKSVHVKGYYRKDGTYVAPYDRSAPGTASHAADGATSYTYSSYKKNYLAEGYSADPSVQRDSHGKIKRSKEAKSAFERQSACPSTGKTTGKCPGYVVDHINPLECGGADAPSNMQWQTVADGKAKDKTEGSCRH